MDTEYSVYLGAEQKNGFTGFLSESNFFCIVEIFDGYTAEQGEILMSALTEVGEAEIDSLINFDASISGVLKRLNVPLDTSVAVGCRSKSVLYLKTVGTGEIYIQRGKVFEKIIGGNNIASGIYKKSDLYLLTSSFFTDSLKGIHHVKSFIHKNPHIREYPELVKQHVGMEDDTGAIALFVRLQGQTLDATTNVVYPTRLKDYIKNHVQFSKKTVIYGVIGICLVILLWSIINGFQKNGGVSLNQSSSFDSKVTQAEQTIDEAKTKTEAISEGMNNLDDAKAIIESLRKTASKNQQSTITDLQTKVSEVETLLLKRESKEAQLHYDLTIEEKGAIGTKFALFEDKAFILNPEGKVYIFALEKKSFEKRKLSKKPSADSLVGGYEKNAFVLDPKEGIIRINEEGVNKTVISKETQWNEIPSMQIYNGNIYLLDGGNNALYKYPVTTDGYGDRMSYFKGSYLDLDTKSTFAIDIAVYVANTTAVEKYTAGIRDDFTFKLPVSTSKIDKIITHTDQTELYLWNKKEGLLYIVGRDGTYKRQIASSTLKSATDIEVYNNVVYMLQSNNIYRIEL